MPPRPPRDQDSTVHYEPLRASVLDVFEQLGAFDDGSGIVEWIFPDVREQKELQRSRVRITLPEVEVEVAEPEPQTPTQKSTRGFFGIRPRSRSKSRAKKEPNPTLPTAPTKLKPKKSRSSPNLRKDAEKDLRKEAETAAPAVPPIYLPPPPAGARRLSIFPRKGGQSLDQPRPSISDEEWQQITMTGSIADYETNPFLGVDPHGNNDVGAGPVKRDGLQKHFSRFTNSFTRSTPTSPTQSTSTFTPRASTMTAPTPTSPRSPTSDSTPTEPAPPLPPLPTSPTTEHSNASTSTLPAAPRSPSIKEVPREDKLETSAQMDHVRMSLSDISEGEVSESSTLSMKSDRKSQSSEVGSTEAPQTEESEGGSTEAPRTEETA
ncbi:hypothetical protein B0H17DRAFT_1195686 [Mycena rosella]|uniref:Uncharacterized protein n=1 Tax=Mycena rosella TaxID=1033263 RepID=A0AAD7GQT6_MYCRO|nr:hypothetical protein B0H17DRAFT_1195686 [Mycena rosella]